MMKPETRETHQEGRPLMRRHWEKEGCLFCHAKPYCSDSCYLSREGR